MKVLIDTNVVLDILLHREPWYFNAAFIFGFTKKNIIQSFVSATTITDIFYLSKKDLGKKDAKESIKKLFQIFYPAAVTDMNIYKALDLDWDDFEDSVQYAVGESFSVDYIITRNTKDFSNSGIPAVTPEQFINIITDN